jgi:hypothetical protein
MGGGIGQALLGDVAIGGIDFGADEFPSFQKRRHTRGAAAGKGIQNHAARRAHLHDGAHQFGGFAGDVVLVGLADRFNVIARQIADFHARWHIALAAPHGVFRAVTKASWATRTSGRFQPRHDPAPRRTGRLQRIGGAGKLPPIGEQHHR